MLRYTAEWERYVTRQARWVDFENDYKTLDLDYMESVMWAFKTLWDKGLVYEGFKVLAYCWRCETPLSNTETRMDDVYFDRQDPALTVGLLADDAGAPTGDVFLPWTTTPWTLPANLYLAVGPDIDYAVENDGRRLILAEQRLEHYVADPRRGRNESARLQGEGAPRASVTDRCSTTSPTPVTTDGQRVRCLQATTSPPRKAPDRPPGAGLRRGRPGRRHAVGSRRSCRWTSTAGTPPMSRRGRASRPSMPTRTSSVT